MHKFFVNEENIKDDYLWITGEDVQHISKVLRLRQNDQIQVCGKGGNEFICSISEISKQEVICRINDSYPNKAEANIEITLFQGIPKSQKMDLIIQKCVEIGVVNIIPVITKRVVIKIDDRDITPKLERWRRISEEAAKQSDRGFIPKVFEPITFDTALSNLKAMDLGIIPYENEKQTGLKSLLKEKTGVKKIGIFIGPEGGFDSEEIDKCLKNNLYPVTLGPRILRTETAGFVAATIILYEIGDMGGII
jgi:16S rRNA (uracil1498-N3)-methyltransferase